MKQVTRAMIAAAAAEKVSGQYIEKVYDHTLEEALPVPKHLQQQALREDRDALVLHLAPEERVSLEVHEDLFSGWDHLTGAYFAGAMYQSDVMLYDGFEGRYYKFSVH